MSHRPNLLLVIADQLVPFLTGAYGHPVVRTPALDALAARGIRFDAAYTPYPLCAPARAAFMTGQHASAIGCWDNAAVLPADEPTLAHYLTNAGYETVLSGKMHFIGPDQLHGFRRRLTTDVFPAGLDWVPTQDEDGKFVRGGHARAYTAAESGPTDWTKFFAYDEEVQFRALEFLRGRPRDAEPFFLAVSFHHPHDPFRVTPDLWDLYEGAEIELPTWPDDLSYSVMDGWANEAHETDAVALDERDLYALRRSYYGLVTYVDRKLGELLATVPDDTLVVFTSDHGDMLGERRMVQKRVFYEWSVRVPLVVAFPDGRHAGTALGHPVSLLDLVPTLLDVAGVPEGERLPVAGASLFEPGRAIFSEYHVEKVRAPSFMVRRDALKYVYTHGHDERLFDLDADPGEWRDLAPERPEAAAGLRALILERFDPERIAAAGAESVRRRELIRRAMARNGTRWDYQPFVDATRQYVR